nr:hypothetical protein [Methylobacterium sp. L1A1]
MRKPVLDHGKILTVHHVVTGGGLWRLVPGDRRVSSSSWRYRDGSPAGSISHIVEIYDEDAGTLTLEYRLNDVPKVQAFALLGRPCRFGGRRWLARCPTTGKAVAKLYGCTGLFHSRHVLDASYRSQDRVPAGEKLRDREVAILRRLEADDSSPPTPPKPKRMRADTYVQLIRELGHVRSAYGLALAREFFTATGIDLTDGEAPEVSGRRGARAL